MTTQLKNQSLDISVMGEQGFGGLRYYEGKLQVYQDDEWTTVVGDDKIPVESIAITVHGVNNRCGDDYEITTSGKSARCADSFWATATVLPENATDPSVTWSLTSTDNNDKGIIDPQTGVISENDGINFTWGSMLTITATANDGSGNTGTITVVSRAIDCKGPC